MGGVREIGETEKERHTDESSERETQNETHMKKDGKTERHNHT